MPRANDDVLFAPIPWRLGCTGLMVTAVEQRHMLLHQAVTSASLGAAAVVLRAGADPMQPPDDAAERHNAVHIGSSALALAAADVLELLRYADGLDVDDHGAWLTRLAVRLAPARRAAPHAIAMLWLLGRAAAARHGADAVEVALPPSALAVLRAAPYAVPGLAANGRVSSFGVARVARALLLEAEAYIAAGDNAAAQRAFSARRARAVTCIALCAAPASLLAVTVLAPAAVTIAPFAVLVAPIVVLVYLFALLLDKVFVPRCCRCLKAASAALKAILSMKVVQFIWQFPLGLLLYCLFLPLECVFLSWRRTITQLGTLAITLFAAGSRGW